MNNRKICSFYVSESHLLTIILPYINEEMQAGRDIVIVSQNDISHDVKQYLKNVKHLSVDIDKILKLRWKNNKKEEFFNCEKKIFIVIGEEEYIENINQKIDDNLCENEIINCYKITKIKKIDDILNKHSMILNTKGKKENSQNEQKRKTIKSQI